MVSLVTLRVGCRGGDREDDAAATTTLPAAPAATAEATTPAAPATSTAVAPAASPTAGAQAATPTDTPQARSTAREVVPTPILVGSPAADLPVAGQITATIPVGASPSVVAAGHGAIRVYHDIEGFLARIDPATNMVVATIPIATPLDPANPPSDLPGLRQANPDLVIDAPSVWAIRLEEQGIVQVDPQTNTVVATIPLDAKATSIAVNETSLWVSLYATSTVLRIDTATGAIEAAIRDVPTPYGIAIDQDAVWMTNLLSDRVTHIDPSTNQVVKQVVIAWPGAPFGIHECSLCARDVLSNEYGVWVMLHFTEYIAPIDPASNRLAAVIPVGNEACNLASDARDVWVGTVGKSGVVRIDPATNQVIAAVPAEGPQQLTFVTGWKSTLWAAGVSTGEVVRIELQRE